MNKFYDTVQDERGVVLPGYRVQVVTSAGDVVDIFSDRGGTRFTDAAGNTVNYATADGEGLAEFFYTAADGQIAQILKPNGDLFKSIDGFADNFVLDNLPGNISQDAITGLDASLAAKADSAALAADTGAALIGTASGATVGESLSGFATRADIAALTPGGRVYLREGGRAGVFIWSGDNLSADVAADTEEGIYVPPDTDPTGASGAWVRSYDGRVLPEWFGAKGDGLTDDSAAIQAAFDLTGQVHFSRKTYRAKGVLLDGVSEAISANSGGRFVTGDLGSRIVNDFADGTDLFILASQNTSNFLTIELDLIWSKSGAGHVFSNQGAFNHNRINVRHVVQSEPSKAILVSEGHSFFFNNVEGDYWSITSAHDYPAIRLTSPSNLVSANKFEIQRPNFSGTRHFMELLSTSASDYNYGNIVRLLYPEKTAGGVLLTARDFNTHVWSHLFDVTVAVSPTVNHMIQFGQTGFISFKPHVENYMRNSGVLGSGLVDIMLEDCRYAYLEHVSGVSSVTKVQIDLNNAIYPRVQHAAFADILNSGELATVADQGGIVSPRLSSPKPTNSLTIAGGAITVTANFHAVDTEAFAATDDLVSINGGVDGQRLVLRSVANARDVTLRDAGGNLKLNGDFTLNRTTDTIELIYDESTGVWLELSRSDNDA